MSGLSHQSALRFVILLGVVSLLADFTYEGARSISGQFLASLGATGAVVGIVAGFGELISYGLRLASGRISDRTQRYWGVTLAGYLINLLAVPLLALAGRWEVAAALLIAERAGKGLRTPPRDAMLSHATSELGRGWGFGLHEALDQLGAVAGPVIVAAVIHARNDLRTAFAILLIPAVLALAMLVTARYLYPRPQELETGPRGLEPRGLPSAFWLYLAAAAFVAAGYIDFPLIAYHFQKTSTVPGAWIPLLYALAMSVDALSALVFGRIFDRLGIKILAWVPLISAFFAPLALLGGFREAVVGMVLWGIGMGAQESVMRAAVAGMVAGGRRATAYGVFSAGYGLVWFLGSALMGLLYDVSLAAVVIFSVLMQLVSVPLFLVVSRPGKLPGPAQ